MKFITGTLAVILLACVAACTTGQQPSRISGQPFQATALRLDFEAPAAFQPFTLANSRMTTEPEYLLDGRGSLLADTRTTTTEWNEVLVTRPGAVAGNQRYLLTLDYRILDARTTDTYLLLLINSPTERRLCDYAWHGYVTWMRPLGQSGRIVKRIALPDYPDYSLHLGIHKQGAVLIDNLELRRVTPLTSATLAQGEPRPAAPGEEPYEPYGICAHFGAPWADYANPEKIRRGLAMLSEAGIQWFRTTPTWTTLEPERGKFDPAELAKLDLIVDEGRKNGLKSYFLLLGTAVWANRNGDWMGVPHDLDAWRRYVRHLALHFKGRVRHWEVWNEIDWIFWKGTLAEYVALLRATYEELKAVDPQNRIIIAGLASDGRNAWSSRGAVENALQQLYDLGIKDCTDILALHPYSEDMKEALRWGADSFRYRPRVGAPSACAALRQKKWRANPGLL